MIAAWMAWAAAAGVLLALAAHLAEGALRRLGRPTRLAWAVALLVGIVLPPAAWLQARRAAEAPAAAATSVAAGSEGTPAEGAAALDALLARARVTVAAPPVLARLDRPLLAGWALVSLLGLGRLLLAGRRLRRARAEWRRDTVDGVAVLVAGRTGPAVAGVLRPAVVLPEWALEEDPALVRLMLAHEREHVRAGDPTLLAAAAVLATVVPWSPAVWYGLRRLRLAVEADCDRRVLRHHPDVRRYGGLLLEVGRRLPSAEPLPLAALASSPSHLERRIRLMTMSRPRHPVAAGLGLLAAASALALAACEMPRPTEVAPAGEMPLASIRSGGAYTVSGKLTTGAVREAVAVALKDSDATAARGTPVSLYFIADASGRVVHAEYQRHRTLAGLLPTRTSTEARRAGVDSFRVRMRMSSPEQKVVASVRMAPMSGAVASLDPAAIGSIEIMKAPPGEIVADSTSVIWVTLKEGATLEGARLTGEALREAQGRRERAVATERAWMQTVPMPGGTASGGGARAEPSVRSARTDLSAPNAPILVVEGVVIAREQADTFMRDLSSDRIESVEVVKGAAAERLYGERGANGVINVTLKKR